MSGGRALSILDIETGLEERFEAHGHCIHYAGITYRHSSGLGCCKCRTSTRVSVNRFGGWVLSNDDLDKKCES